MRIKVILLIALLLRLFFAFRYDTGDTGAVALATNAFLKGESVYSNPHIYFSPPPFALHMLSFLRILSDVLFLPYYGFWKILAVFSDIGIGYIIYYVSRFINKKSQNFSSILSVIYLFNPITILISGYHGQQESVWIFLILVSWISLIKKYNIFISAVFSGLAISYKIPAIIIIPLFYTLMGSFRERIIFYTIITSVFLISLFPELLTDTKGFMDQVIFYSSTAKVWGISLILNKLNLADFLITQKIILFMGLFCWYVSVIKRNSKRFFNNAVNAVFIFLFLTPGFGTQYLLWPLPFLILARDVFTFVYVLLVIFGLVHFYSLKIYVLDKLLELVQYKIYYPLKLFYPYDLLLPIWVSIIGFYYIPAKFYNALKSIIKIILLLIEKLLISIERSWLVLYMSKTRKRYPSFTIFLFFLIAILLFYHRAFFGYFQSDEWFYFTQFLPLTRESSGIILALYKSIANSLEVSSGGHLTPIYNIFWFLHNLVFGINYQPYIILSIFFHTINTFLVHLFTLHITKSKTIAIIAGLFFGLSYVHFQAITWIMAYIPTQLSVTFLLLSLIFLIRILKNYSFKGIVLVALFFICSLLSKESAVILFLIIPQIAFFSSSKWVYKKNVFLMTIFVGFLYIPYRFILPLFFHGGDTVKLNLDIGLTFFRIITYPLKMITEVFIPSPLILSLSEYLTPYAYPMYAIDKDVRGTAFLTFTQNAGSDIIIYIFSTLFILLIIYGLIKSYKKREQLLSVSVGVSFIVFSALPLILISIYAPWWGYVTFIDSRHIYLASIGGSVIFSTLINSIMSKIRIKNLNNICLVIIIATWMTLQYSLLQQQLEAERKVAMSRKNIISIITQDVPKGIKNKIIVVESDSNYYGFYSIPPFQTGLGQVLAVNFYQRNDLPSEFLHFPDFSKKGPVSEGYTVFSGIRFGYFHSMSSFYKAQNDLIFSEDELYVFQWLGKENQLINTTNEQRKKYKELKHLRQQTKDWTKNTIGVFSYSHPKYFLIAEQIAEGDNQVRRIKPVSSGQNILISYFSKDKSVFFHEYVHNLIAGDGKVINDRFQVMNVTRSDGSLMTLVKVNSEKGEEYYIPSSTGDSFLVIRNEEGTINSGKSDDIIDTLIKTTFQDI